MNSLADHSERIKPTVKLGVLSLIPVTKEHGDIYRLVPLAYVVRGSRSRNGSGETLNRFIGVVKYHTV